MEDYYFQEELKNFADHLAQTQMMRSAKSRIDLFHRTDNARELFEHAERVGRELDAKYQAGIEISKEDEAEFAEIRDYIRAQPMCCAFMESRSDIKDILDTIAEYLRMTALTGELASDEEVAESLERGFSRFPLI